MTAEGTWVRVGRQQLVAVGQFAAILIVLVVLPDRSLDAVFGLNPRTIWLVVAFIAGLSLAGHLLSAVLSASTALGVTGVLGGSASPGLTISWLATESRRAPDLTGAYASAAVLAATMLFLRNLAVVTLVDRSFGRSIVPPFLAMAGVAVAVAVARAARAQRPHRAGAVLALPFRLRPAFAFGAVVAAILAALNAFDLSIDPTVGRLGVVVVTLIQLSVYVTVSWSLGAREMARWIAFVLVGSGAVGISVVHLA